MDELAGPSFFDYAATSHPTMSSSLDLPGSGLDTVMKQEAYDSTAWIQGCSDLSSGIEHGFASVSYHSQISKPAGFLQNQTPSYMANASLENLMSETQTSNSSQGSPFNPLEMILNQPSPIEILKTASAPEKEPQNPLFSTSTSSDSLNISMQSQSNLIKRISPVTVVESQVFPTAQASFHEVSIQSTSIHQPSEVTLEVKPKNVTVPVAAPVVQKEIDPEKDLNLYITNVVSSFRVRCHLNLRKIAQEGMNVIYQKESKKVVMRIRRPSCTAYVWSSGKIVCTGANSEIAAKKAARKFARRLQKMGFRVVFSNFKIINVLAVCKMPYHIDIVEFSNYHRSKYLSYEPELHPAVTYRIPEWKVTFKIFSTGSITLTCPVVSRAPEAVKRIHPLVVDFFRFDKPNDLASSRRISVEEEVDSEETS